MTNSIINPLNALLFGVVVVDLITCEDELFIHSSLPCYYVLFAPYSEIMEIFFLCFLRFSVYLFPLIFGYKLWKVHEKMHEVWIGRRETCYQSVNVRSKATRWRRHGWFTSGIVIVIWWTNVPNLQRAHYVPLSFCLSSDLSRSIRFTRYRIFKYAMLSRCLPSTCS